MRTNCGYPVDEVGGVKKRKQEVCEATRHEAVLLGLRFFRGPGETLPWCGRACVMVCEKSPWLHGATSMRGHVAVLGGYPSWHACRALRKRSAAQDVEPVRLSHAFSRTRAQSSSFCISH